MEPKGSLQQKLVEEAYEVLSAVDMDELREEIADVIEVTEAIKKTWSLSDVDIEKIRNEKAKKSGTFQDKCYIETFELTESSPDFEKFMKNEKYPLIEKKEKS